MLGVRREAYFRYASNEQRRSAPAIDNPRGISSAGRAPALQAGGRRFDPVILHHLAVLGSPKHAIIFDSTQKQSCLRLLLC